MRAPYLVALLVLLAGLCCACGSGGGYNLNDVTVSVSPATTSVATNGQVTLQATVNGLCSSCSASISLWYISENNSQPINLCTNTPLPAPGCTAGTIQVAGYPSLTATYSAPSTPGTYHVIAEWYLTSFLGDGPMKTGTAVVTVTP